MRSKGLVVAPDGGIDVGIARSKGRYLVSSSDPITGAVERVGWHAVNVSANDVATSGIMPDTLNIIALFPEDAQSDAILKVMDEINETASALGITVAGGHTVITPNLKREIIMVTAFGSGDKFVTAADAKVHDSILLTKSAGIEGTSILSRVPGLARLVDPKTLSRGRKLLNKLSIMRDASEAFATGKVHAMHDLTEGGVIGCLLEMSLASELGFELFRDRVPLDESTREICSELKIDPLKLIGSGSLLIACEKADVDLIVNRLKIDKILCTEIGRFLPQDQGRWILSKGSRKRIDDISVQDELWPALSKYGNLP
jgi:hydrogenase expression/formation protein HypE